MLRPTSPRSHRPALILRVATLLVAAVMVASCSSSSDDADTSIVDETTAASASPAAAFDLQLLVDDWVASEGLVGAIVAVATGNDITTASAGVVEVGTTDAIGPNHRFRLGSVTKLFTATLVLRLAEEGFVVVDEPIANVGPFPPGITTAHLLSHSSGFVDGSSHADTEAALRAGEVAFEPGTQYRYANANYIVLGRLIAGLTGSDYETALTDFVLEPLGLDNTGFDAEGPDMAAPHEPGEPPRSLRGPGIDAGVRASGASGALISDVYDLVAFAEALFGGEIVSRAAVERMRDATSTPGPNYGLGIQTYGPMVFGHDGTIGGFGASLRHNPTTGLTVVVLCNVETPAVRSFANSLVTEASSN